EDRPVRPRMEEEAVVVVRAGAAHEVTEAGDAVAQAELETIDVERRRLLGVFLAHAEYHVSYPYRAGPPLRIERVVHARGGGCSPDENRLAGRRHTAEA